MGMVREAALKTLYSYKGTFTKQQYKTLKGQIYAGDINGFYRGVQTLLEKAKPKNRRIGVYHE